MARSSRQLVEAGVAFSLFAIVSYLGRHTEIAFHLMGLIGLAIPLIWGWRSGCWVEMGFTKTNVRQAILWGFGAGILTSLLGIVVVGEISPPPDLALQLAAAIPMSLLLASPFQEFFFRGWLQPRFTGPFGKWGGLLVTTGFFALWHYLAPLDENTAFPLDTVIGFLSTYLAGAIYGYVFQRTRNIVAPWLAHALSLITFVAIGTGGFLPSS